MKHWHQSLTIRGALLAITAVLAPYTGIAPEEAQPLVDAICAVVAASGALLSIVGRIRANQRIQTK